MRIGNALRQCRVVLRIYFEYETALKEASPSVVEVSRRSFQAGLHLAAGAFVALAHRTGLGGTSVTDLGPNAGPFGGHFGDPVANFAVTF